MKMRHPFSDTCTHQQHIQIPRNKILPKISGTSFWIQMKPPTTNGAEWTEHGLTSGLDSLILHQRVKGERQGRHTIQISEALSPAHRINPNISLMVPGIETKHKKISKSMSIDQTNISECIEFYPLVFLQRGPGAPWPPIGTMALVGKQVNKCWQLSLQW